MRPLLLVLLVLGLAAPAQADEAPTVSSVLEKMHASYKGVKAVRAAFVQTSTGMSYFEPLKQTGVIVLESPGKMRWEFETPRKQQYLSDGTTLWVVDEGDKTCTVFRSVDGMLQRFYGFLTGTADLKADFRVEVVTEETTVADATALKLTPLQPDGSIESLRVFVSTKNHRVVGISMITPFGDRTDTVLSDVTTLDDVPDEQFAWSDREGFRVIQGD